MSIVPPAPGPLPTGDETYDEELACLAVEPGVLAEARLLVRILGLKGVARVLTRKGKCRVHVPGEDEPSKRCGTCRTDLTLDSFAKNRITPDGLQHSCRQCDYTTQRIKQKSLKHKVKSEVEKEGIKARHAFKKQLAGGDKGPVRSVWPTNPVTRRKQLLNMLPKAIKAYDGQEAQISVALNLPLDEIKAAIDSDKRLVQALRHAQIVAISKVEANAYRLARDSNNVAAVKLWLTNKTDTWHDRSSIEMKNVGFAPVSEEETDDVAPILKIVNKHPED